MIINNSKKEIINLDSQFPINFFNAKKDKNNVEYLHYHDCLEINYVISGTGVNLIDNNTYIMETGDLFIINNLSHHMSISNRNLEMKIITFKPDFIYLNDIRYLDYLKSFYKKKNDLNNKISLTKLNQKLVYDLFIRIEKEFNNKNVGYKLFIRSLLLELLAIIYRNIEANENNININKSQVNYERIHLSIEYINQNFTKSLSLDEIASLSNLSRNYFCSIFKKVMNMTSIQYIDLIRINKACLLLKTSAKSILEISLDCGYNNLTSFNSAFKKICNVTPTNYRKNQIDSNIP